MDSPIVHNAVARQFMTVVEGHECVIDYQLRDRVMTILHTGVPQPVEGRGIAARLTHAVLQVARGEGWTVVPACSYAAAYFEKHPEYADLLS